MFDTLSKGIKSVIKKVKTTGVTRKELIPIVENLKSTLISNDVAVVTADAIGEEIINQLEDIDKTRFTSPEPMVIEALKNSITKILSINLDVNFDLFQEIDQKLDETSEPYIICMLGINGTGKTTSIAKLTHLLTTKGYSVVLAASDTYRAGSIQQLGKHAEKLGVKMIAHDYGGDPAAVAIDAIEHAISKDKQVVIIDTAGRMQNNVNLVRELTKIIRIAEPDLKIFVGDSLAGNDVVRQANQFNIDIAKELQKEDPDVTYGIDGIIMTKLDSDAKGGAILSVAHVTQRPVFYVGVGQGYDDLKKFDPMLIVDQLLK